MLARMDDGNRNLATYADLLALPEGADAEVMYGVVQTLPSALPEHNRAQGGLQTWLGGPFDLDDGHGGPGGWWILIETDVRFSVHTIVRPDIVGWRRSRLEADIGGRLFVQRPVLLPPARSLGFVGHLDQLVAYIIRNAIEATEISYIPGLDAAPGSFHSGNLGLGAHQLPCGILDRQIRACAKSAEASAQLPT